VGMVVAKEEMSLLTVCENGYGKRTPFGPGDQAEEENGEEIELEVPETTGDEPAASASSGMRYRRQKRGGKGLRDIKTTRRNGQVVGTLAVEDGDDVLMVSWNGQIQRIRAGDISLIGRNTQGVRIMRLDTDDKIAGLAWIPAEIAEETTASLQDENTEAAPQPDEPAGEDGT